MDYHIGDEAYKRTKTHNVSYLLEHGEVKNWELIEKFWHRCFFNYLKADPEEHNVVLTEPPMNPPENRETMAEVMFETYNVKGLYIGVQAVMAMYSSWCVAAPGSKQYELGLTGIVVDSGDGVTHVIPIADGFVIGSCIKSMPIAGRDITKFILRAMKDRGEPLPSENTIPIVKEIKDKYAYISKDPVKEFQKYDERTPDGGLSKKFKKWKDKDPISGQSFALDLGYEMFLAPEMLFRPVSISFWRLRKTKRFELETGNLR